MKKNGGIFGTNRMSNEKIILEFLRKNGPTFREYICKSTGLHNSAVSRTLKRLRHRGLVQEEKGKSDTRGPKPIIVSLKQGDGFIAGALIYASSIFAGLFTTNLELIDTKEAPLRHSTSPENLAAILHKTICDLMAKNHIPTSSLMSLGVTLPGLILPDGLVKTSSPLHWMNVPFKNILLKHFNCHVTISRLTAIRSSILEVETVSDLWSHRVIFYIHIGDGVGGMLVSGGKVFMGGSGFHCQVGHIIADQNGPVCGCGSRGCFESLISGPAIAEKIKNDIKNNTQTILSKLIRKNSTGKEIIIHWGTAMQRGDSYALKLREFVGEYFGRLAAIVVNCYDPNVIILGGYVANQCPNYLRDKFKEKMNNEVCVGNLHDISIIITEEKDADISSIKSVARAALWEMHKI